jgi:phosphoglycerol transferase MdoB-like AlkP superfamily enzyme
MTGERGTVGILSLLGVLFIGLKLADIIDWSWWWVLLPFYVELLLVIIILAGIFILPLLLGFWCEKRSKTRD